MEPPKAKFPPCGSPAKATQKLDGGSGGADHITGLHDSLLHRILSFLPAADVVRTSALSRRWRHVYASSPNLDFDDRIFAGAPCFEHRRLKYLLMLDQLPRLRGNDAFLQFMYIHVSHGRELCRFPRSTTLASLERLYIIGVRFASGCFSGGATISLGCPCLRVCSMVDCAGLKDVVVDCPLLVLLQISYCLGLQNLRVTGGKLCSVSVERCFQGPRYDSPLQSMFYIDAPRLERLNWRGWVRDFSAGSTMTDLRDASVAIEYVGTEESPSRDRAIKLFWSRGPPMDVAFTGVFKLMRSLAHTKSITITWQSLMYLGGAAYIHHLPPLVFPAAQELTLPQPCTEFRQSVFKSCWFLQGLPRLQILKLEVLNNDILERCGISTYFYKNVKDILRYASQYNLWEVYELSMQNFRGKQEEVGFVKCLLVGLPNLKKIVIVPAVDARQDLNFRKVADEMLLEAKATSSTVELVVS